jgi:hypothetical protein
MQRQLSGRIGNNGFALEHLEARRFCIQPIQALFLQLDGFLLVNQLDGVVLGNFVALDDGRSRKHLDPRIGQAGGEHSDGAIFAQPQEHAGGQQNFRAPVFGPKLLVFLDVGELPELRLNRLVGK